MGSIFAFEQRRVDMEKFRRFCIGRILVMLVLMFLVSCVKVVEPIAYAPTSNLFAKKATYRIIIKDKVDTNSSNSMVSKQWDNNFISGSGHSDLSCD